MDMRGMRFMDEGEVFETTSESEEPSLNVERWAFQIFYNKMILRKDSEEYGEGVVKKAWGQCVQANGILTMDTYVLHIGGVQVWHLWCHWLLLYLTPEWLIIHQLQEQGLLARSPL